jgi:hypothetical protein
MGTPTRENKRERVCTKNFQSPRAQPQTTASPLARHSKHRANPLRRPFRRRARARGQGRSNYARTSNGPVAVLKRTYNGHSTVPFHLVGQLVREVAHLPVRGRAARAWQHITVVRILAQPIFQSVGAPHAPGKGRVRKSQRPRNAQQAFARFAQGARRESLLS